MTAVFDSTDFDDHEQVRFFYHPASGLRSIIAVHRTRNGRGGGGVRMYPYESEQEALADVLRLSKAMSYKMALAGLPFGGAKTVIIGDPATDKSTALLHAYGRALESMGGTCLCGPDVGTTADDMAVIAETTQYVRGQTGKLGDTSPTTALGVCHAIRAAVKHKHGRDDLAGTTVAVQGLGGVGEKLCKLLDQAGADLVVADPDHEAVTRVVDSCAASALGVDEILFAEVDVLAPCALGAVLNHQTIPGIRAGIICGGANNQLADDGCGAALAARHILYAPDYVVNAGGAILAAREDPMFAGQGEAEILQAVAGIYDTLLDIFARAEADKVPPNLAADRLAEEIING